MENYRIESLLGEGAQGKVYLVSDLRTSEFLTMKVYNKISPKLDAEINILKKLGDVCQPHILCFKEKIIQDGKTYLFFSYAVGYNLEELDYDPSSVEDLLWSLLEQMLQVLDVLESRNVVHRDLKLANIIYNPATNIFTLLDFGLSCSEDCSTFSGTPAYFSQELTNAFQYDKKITRDMLFRNDAYALGNVAFRIANNDLPYQAVSMEGPFDSINIDFKQPERWNNIDLSSSLIYVIDRLITGQNKASTFIPFFQKAKALRNRSRPSLDEIVGPNEIKFAALQEMAQKAGTVWEGLQKKDLYFRLYLVGLIPIKG
jgi:serine/threonine protein kinase